jgi:glutamate-1-semialdehyde 2,1-aminomutase
MAFHASFGHRDPVTDHQELRKLDLERYARFAAQLSEHGVWVAARGIWYVSAAHGPKELTAVLERVDAAMS